MLASEETPNLQEQAMEDECPFAYDTRTADKFVVRMPPGLRERVSALASSNARSMNNEIVVAIFERVSRSRRVSTAVDQAMAINLALVGQLFNNMPPLTDYPALQDWKARMAELLQE
jgi:hypothetical protein